MDMRSLANLCTICHTETPKYRCPRCKTQTCSLVCYKRHQQRASCSGKRDPTSFVKKSQWTTPAGIDHDYNYLRTVERSIDGASQDARDRGVGVVAPSSKGAAKAWQPGSTLQQYLAIHHIRVERAPVGMSRSKSNQTRISKNGNVNWTVEWIDADGDRHLHNDCTGSLTLEDLYTTLQAELRNSRRRQAHRHEDTSERQAKRRRTNDESESGNKLPNTQQPGQVQQPFEPAPEVRSEGSGTGADTGSISNPTINQENEPQTQKTYFYLLKPATTNASRVLIPCDANATLTDSLRERTVQEYPTIYVLGKPHAALPEGFVLEDDYQRTLQRPKCQPGIRPERHDNVSQAMTAAEQRDEKPSLDANAILDMLRRDVTV